MSFSNNKDSLPLWTNYGREDGYNIRFSKDFFNDIFKGNLKFTASSNGGTNHTYSPMINEIIYDKTEQISIINDLLDEIHYCDTSDEPGKDKFIHIYINFVIEHIIFFKSPGHKPEKEYRLAIIFDNEGYKSSILKHRAFKGAFIPYVEFELDLKYIKEITIGPNNNFDLVKKGLESYISCTQNLTANISESDLILRF